MAGFDLVRELWLRRTLRASKTAQGAPPLSFTAKAGRLRNYRIYGNTVNAASVGDRTGNLFDENSLISPISGFTWYFDDEHYLLATNTTSDTRSWSYSQSQFFIALSAGTYTLRLSGVGANIQYSEIRVCKSNGDLIDSENIAGKSNIVITFTLNTSDTIGIEIKLYNGKYRFMLNEGTVPLPYEPYGYKVPVTVTNGTNTETTNIYLDEPLGKSGDDTDYIDYKTQKRYNIDGTSEDVTLPGITVPAGTDTLSVGTTVQPSAVKINYKKG